MKFALVTGGSRGIGKAICLKLAEDGYHVLINYLSNSSAAEETKSEIEAKGASASLLPFDVSNADAVNTAIQQWKDDNPDSYIEVLVNNAGIREDNLMIWMTQENWSNVINSNLNSFFLVTKPLLEAMLLKKFGRIINVVSLSGLKGLSGQINYSAAKAGVIGATKALAQEVGKKKVTVNAIAPGYISTDMTKDLPEKELKKMIPLNRFGKAEEVADLVAFLASEKASYITGETISINGGLYT